MPIAHTLAYYGSILVVCWIVWWYLVYLVSGFHLRSVSINNGISFNGISYTSRSVSVTIGSLRFRLWGNSRKIILDDLNITLKKKDQNRKKSRSKKNGGKPKQDEADRFIIFPSSSLPRALARLLVCHIPTVDLELRNSRVHFARDHHVTVEYLQFTLSSRYSKRYLNKLKFDLKFVLTNTNQVYTHSGAGHHVGHVTPTYLSDLKANLGLSLDLDHGVVENIKLKVFVNDLKVSVYNIFKYFIIDFIKNGDNKKNHHKDEEVQSSKEHQKRQLAAFMKHHRKLHSTLTEISVHLENVSVAEIPFATIADNQDFDAYFHGERPQTSLDVTLKSAFVNFTKLYKESAGFEVLFDPLTDTPVHMITSFQLLRLNFSKLIPTHSGNIGKKSNEILSIPNWSCTYKTNILDHFVNGRGFKNCVMELFSSTSSPVLDLDTKQASELFYNMVLIKKYMKLRILNKAAQKQKEEQEQDVSEEEEGDEDEDEQNYYREQPEIRFTGVRNEEDADITIDSDESNPKIYSYAQERTQTDSHTQTETSGSQSSVFKDYLFKLLNDFYPRLDIKLIVEQPRFIVRHYDPVKEKVQLLNFSYSLLDFHLLTTASRNYDANCQILSPSTRYLEKSSSKSANASEELINQDIVKVDQVNFHFEILKNLKFRSNTEIYDVKVDLIELDILTGINNLLNDVTGMAEKDLSIGVVNLLLNSKIVNTRNSFVSRPKELKHESSKSLEDKLFNYLPSWLMESQFKLTSVSVLLGSRSVLIPKELIANIDEDGLKDDFIGDKHSLRYVKFGLESLQLALNNTSEQEEAHHELDELIPVSTSSTASSETLTPTLEDNNKFTYWSVSSKLTNFTVSMMLNLNSKEQKLSSFLILPVIEAQVNSKVNDSHENQLVVDINMSELKLNFDRSKTFIVIGAIYLFREFLITPIKIMYQKLRSDLKKVSTQPFSPNPQKAQKSLLSLVSAGLKIDEMTIMASLGSDFKTKIQVVKSVVSIEDGIITVSNDFLRGLTESPLVKNKWSRVICVDNVKVLLNEPNSENKANILTEAIRFIHPHSFVAHKLFDSISATVKVLKYTVQCLIHESNNKHKTIQPKESKTIDMPKVRLRSNKVTFNMEDDPFESELNMIYQLGLIEQRKRLEQISLFESRAGRQSGDSTGVFGAVSEGSPRGSVSSSVSGSSSKSSLPLDESPTHPEGVKGSTHITSTPSKSENDSEYAEQLENLYKHMSTSWIRKVKVYQEELKKEIIENKRYLFGNEALLSSKHNENVVTYPSCAPLLFIVMKKFDLNLSSPEFDLEELPKFLNEIGQGVPMDTKYSLMIPTHMNLKLDELRMHLRDYPLPLLYVPENPIGADEERSKSKSAPKNNRPCLSLSGHLIISEDLIKTKEHVRNMHLALSSNVENAEKDKYYGITIAKSLSTVKLYTDIQCEFDSDSPSRFVWGQSYQFGIQQAMLNFDQFSKPPVDPSVKLGFWDKMKLIMHGKCSIKTKKSLEIAFKGSTDPYDLFETSSGFILAFRDDVVWSINQEDDSRSFFDIESQCVSWYIPNYLAAPLISWTRDSRKSIYLPASQKFITSCFGYFLQDHGEGSPSSNDGYTKESSHAQILEKNVVNLSGGVHFRVGFLLERKNSRGQRTTDCKPHYEVQLFNPDYTSEGHDSYAGFRSEYIHLAISLNANKDTSYNSIHLSPRTFEQFFKWWKLFSGNMSLPIRRGNMFGEIKKASKFSQLLYTNKFEFNFRSLFLSHIYRDESISREEESIEFVGIRAMIDSFSVDLHQRKEAEVEVHEELSRHKKLMKMKFNIGEIHLSNIDFRVVHAVFKQDIYNNNQFNGQKKHKDKYKIFDDDKRWFDIQDFEEAFTLSLRNCPRNFSVFPLMYAKRFSYVRDTSASTNSESNEEEFGNEDTHKCTLNSQNVFQPQIESLIQRIKELETQVKANLKQGTSVNKLKKRIDFLKDEVKKNERKWSKNKRQSSSRTASYSAADPHSTEAGPNGPSKLHVVSERKGSDSSEEQIQKLEGSKEPSVTLKFNPPKLKQSFSNLSNGTNYFSSKSFDHKSTRSFDSRDRQSSINNEPSEYFNNKFILINILFKWNFDNRNFLLKYIHYVQLKKFIRKYISYESISALEELMMKKKAFSKEDIETISTGVDSAISYHSETRGASPPHQKLSSSERLDSFDKILRQVHENEGISEDYLIEVISPQIQLQSDDEPNSVVIISTPTINSKIVSVVGKTQDGSLDNNKEYATRFGVIMKRANIFILHKEDLVNSDSAILSTVSYGTKTNWPPWLGTEICKNGIWAGEDKLLVEKTSLMIMYEKVKPLGALGSEEAEGDDSEDSGEGKDKPIDKLFVDFPKLIMSSTSKQYFTLYVIVLSLLFYSEPMSKLISEKLEKLKFSIDFQDLSSLHKRLVSLQNYHKIMKLLMLNYGFRQNSLTNEELNDYLMLNMEKGEVVTEIYLMMQTILAGDLQFDSTSAKPKVNWFFKADEIIIHMLEDDRTPIIDIALAKGNYTRVVNEDGSNQNKLEVGMMQGFNLIKNARYQEFLEPLQSKAANKRHSASAQKLLGDNLIAVDWTMNKPIGGIKIIEKIEVSTKPLDIKIDEVTGKKLMLFIFGSDSGIDESPLLTVTNKKMADKDEDHEGTQEARKSTDSRSSNASSSQSSDALSPPDSNGHQERGFLEASEGINKVEDYEGQLQDHILRKDGSQCSIASAHKGVTFNEKNNDSSSSSENPTKHWKRGSVATQGSRKMSKNFSQSSSSVSVDNEYQDQIDKMIERSKKYFSIILFKLHPASLSISISLNKGYKRLLNVQNFLIHLPEFQIRKKILSFLEVSKLLEKMVIKTLLSHSGKLLRNILSFRKKRKNLINKPLKPLKRYAKFTKVSELREDDNESRNTDLA